MAKDGIVVKNDPATYQWDGRAGKLTKGKFYQLSPAIGKGRFFLDDEGSRVMLTSQGFKLTEADF